MKFFNWKTIFPQNVDLQNYRSNISIMQYNNKLYEDDFFGQDLNTVSIGYINLKGNWIIDTYKDDNEKAIIKFTDNKSGQHLEIVFYTIGELLKIIPNINTDTKVIQNQNTVDVTSTVNKKKSKQIIKYSLIGLLGLLSFKQIKKHYEKKTNHTIRNN